MSKKARFLNALERLGGWGADPRIPFGKGWDLARRCAYDAYGRPRPGAAYLQASPLPPAPLPSAGLLVY